MVQDIGIVFLPNPECRNFAIHMTEVVAKALPNYKEAQNNHHITAIHIANLDEKRVVKLTDSFHEFYDKFSSECIKLPITKIAATGGSPETGYKWLDLQFETLPELAKVRQSVVETFCPFHNGILTRMNDNLASFTTAQREQIEKCGVTFDPYLPHITAWYIDLPNESPTVELQNIASSLSVPDGLQCFAKSIALVVLGRNGNAIKILEQHPMCVIQENNEYGADVALSDEL